MKGEPRMYEGGIVALENAKEVLEEGKDAIQWIDRQGETRLGLVLRVDDRALPTRGRLKILVDTRGELDLLTYEKGTARDGIFLALSKGGKDMRKELSEFIGTSFPSSPEKGAVTSNMRFLTLSAASFLNFLWSLFESAFFST